MPRKGASVTQADVARAIRAALSCGYEIRRVILNSDGSVAIEIFDPNAKLVDQEPDPMRMLRI